MPRKLKPRKGLAPRNPFVAVAITKKAGTHRKSNKALRRVDNVGLVAQRSSMGLLIPRPRFDSGQVHHESVSENSVIKSIFSMSV